MEELQWQSERALRGGDTEAEPCIKGKKRLSHNMGKDRLRWPQNAGKGWLGRQPCRKELPVPVILRVSGPAEDATTASSVL